MATISKLALMPGPVIEPELKAFIDECLVPMLVQEAAAELRKEIHVAPEPRSIAESPSRRTLTSSKGCA